MATITYSWEIQKFQSVNNITAGNQAAPAVTALEDGKYFVTWDDPSGDGSVYGRVVGAGGSQFLVNSTTAGSQSDSSVATLSNGTVVVTYTDTSTDAGGEIRARLFTSTGVAIGSDFLVGPSVRGDTDSDVTALADGGFVVTWTRDFGGGDMDIRAQIFNSDGTPRGISIGVDVSSALNTNSSQVVGLANGNFVVVWQQ